MKHRKTGQLNTITISTVRLVEPHNVMMDERVFLDTGYVQALLNPRDQNHGVAKALYPRVQNARELFITEAVIVEICNALSALNRQAAVEFVRGCYSEPQITIVAVDSNLLIRAFQFYTQHHDKEWGLTDCLSFIVMREQDLKLVATGDHHFKQAGFVPLLD